ncbi:DUF6668 family protein [Streptomyces sp. NBC_00271]|uniref:DUF6668 family protein n=1 Tax=Streptomyces sp. NBC_00271 TaxID=2975697 RepID=UPI002E28E5F7|nr:DUF6668 family protein [Streptomyces sp. NBC_00271]
MSVPSMERSGPQAWVRGPTTRLLPGAQAAAAHMSRPAQRTQGHQPATGDHETLVIRPSTQMRRPQRSWTPPPPVGAGTGWVAAHGGAGASTLAAALGGADLGCRWPDITRGEPARVMVVARTNASGLRAASQMLGALRDGRHPPGMELVALVLVADAPGRLPLPLARRVRVLRSAAPVRRVPWVPAWRLDGKAKALPKEVFQLGALAGLRPAEMGGAR